MKTAVRCGHLFVFSTILLQRCLAIQITISQGTLIGKEYTSRNGSSFYGFTGIPFAKPPVGDLRFEPPQEAESWNGILNATVIPPKCIQWEIFLYEKSEMEGQEDCLYLNVFTRDVSNSQNLPVMVWIHGGGYTVGSSYLNWPAYFMDYPIVFVSLAYRLGVFGLLSAGDETLPGNMALKDQTAALKWVQKNIKSFGGNPNKITLTGDSAGASSVHLHLHSPLSSGLFHSAVIQSGSAYCPWAINTQSEIVIKFKAFSLLSACPISSTKSSLKCLKQVDARELLLTQHKFLVLGNEPNIPFATVVETNSNGAFLPKSPWEQDAINNVPLLAGVTSAEGTFKVQQILHNNGKLLTKLSKEYERLFPITLDYFLKVDYDMWLPVTKSIKKHYLGEKEIGIDSIYELVELYSDLYFTQCTVEVAMRYRKKNPVYFYVYDHRNKWSLADLLGNNTEYDLGVCHADDLVSTFSNDFMSESVEGDDLEVSKRIVNYWTNFIFNSNPNNYNEYLWKPLTLNDDFDYLRITTKADAMDKNTLTKNYNFWKSLPHVSSQFVSDKIKNEL